MPRTKRPAAKKLEKTEENERKTEEKKRLEKWVADQYRKIDLHAQKEVRDIEMAFKILIKSIPQKYMSMTVGQLRNEIYLKEVTNTTGNRHSARSADDGYYTESSAHGSGDRRKKTMAAPSTGSRSTSRRSRSAEPSRRAPPSTARPQRRRSRSVYKTPAYNKNAANLYPVITPKVAPETPLTLLRQPRHGEVVVSLTGSPVMVANYSSMQGEDKANCNIGLQDGTVLTVKPTQLRPSQAYIPFSLMGPGIMDQIRTIKDNLEKVLSLGEKEEKKMKKGEK